MKRNQMKATIGSEVCTWLYDHQIEGINLGQIDELNERILSKLESKGMLPPMRYYQNNKACEIDNEWEPE